MKFITAKSRKYVGIVNTSRIADGITEVGQQYENAVEEGLIVLTQEKRVPVGMSPLPVEVEGTLYGYNGGVCDKMPRKEPRRGKFIVTYSGSRGPAPIETCNFSELSLFWIAGSDEIYVDYTPVQMENGYKKFQDARVKLCTARTVALKAQAQAVKSALGGIARGNDETAIAARAAQSSVSDADKALQAAPALAS